MRIDRPPASAYQASQGFLNRPIDVLRRQVDELRGKLADEGFEDDPFVERPSQLGLVPVTFTDVDDR